MHEQTIKDYLISHVIPRVQMPAQYLGGEWNMVRKDPAAMRGRLCLAFPDAYSVGMSHHGFQVLYSLMNARDDWYCERVYAPWRDEQFLARFRGRGEMIDYCEEKKLPIRASRNKPYSTDANLLGLTHEAGQLEYLTTPADFVKPEFGVLPQDAPEQAQKFQVRFEAGRPTAVNGERVSVLEAFMAANRIGGSCGVGINLHLVENRFVGIKSRGIYEQPGI
nr:argininosuccinate synthase [Pirellulaceae bacterium]